MVSGLEIYQSNNLVEAAGVRHGLAGTRSAITFADAIVGVEALRSEKRFGSQVRGLHVYGQRVVRPESLVSIDIALPA